MGKKTTRWAPNQLSRAAEELEEAKRILEGAEVAILSGVAQVLSEAVENPSQAAKNLIDTQSTAWMSSRQATKYGGCKSVGTHAKGYPRLPNTRRLRLNAG